MQVKKQQIEQGMEQWTDSKLGKKYFKAVCILSPCLFNLYAEYIIQNAGLDEAQLESRLPGEILVTSDMQMMPPLCRWCHPYGEEELKNLLMKVKEESEKVGLKFNKSEN